MLDPVERDFNAFSKSQSYAEDFEEAVNERVQQEVDKFFDDLIIDDVQTYLGNDNSIVLELNGNGFALTPDALYKLSDLSTWTAQEYDDAMSEEDDKRRQYDWEKSVTDSQKHPQKNGGNCTPPRGCGVWDNDEERGEMSWHFIPLPQNYEQDDDWGVENILAYPEYDWYNTPKVPRQWPQSPDAGGDFKQSQDQGNGLEQVLQHSP